jgi:ribose 5-phosphate isomerase B
VRWYAGSDHAGFRLKDALVAALRGLGDEVVDLGAADGTTRVDYPDFGARVARAVVAEPGRFGLCVCGTGIGISIAANKVTGARAALATDPYSARMARQHNDANVVCLGERVVGIGLGEDIVRAFRDAGFEGGRHQLRVDQITALDVARPR